MLKNPIGKLLSRVLGIYRDEYGATKNNIAGFDEQVAKLLRKPIVSSWLGVFHELVLVT